MRAADDLAAFERHFERHAPELLRYCFRRTADTALAEDLVATVFLEAWRRRGDLRAGADVRPWLYGIATNVVRHQRRSRRRYATALGRMTAARVDADATDDVVARQQEMRAVLSAVAALPRREQDVLALCVWSGLSYEEAARALGVPVGTVRSRLSRARARLVESGARDSALTRTAEGA